MLKKRKRYLRIWGLTAVCVILTALLAAALWGIYTGQNQMQQIKAQRDQYEQQLKQSQEEQEKLRQQTEELSARVEELTEELKEAETAEGTLSQTKGMSVFSGQGYAPGTIVSYEEAVQNPDSFFQAYSIVRDGEIFQRINGKSYRDNPDIGLEELCYLKILHYNFEHEIQVGELIVNVALKEDVLEIFRQLWDIEYEIQSVRLIDDYWEEGMTGEDADFASIEVNNTSGFNYRPVSGGTVLSYHALGRAIDINPQQNPYVSADGSYSHSNAAPYVDRTTGDPHVIVVGDNCHTIFTEHGFLWGGSWADPMDYQHFEKTE